MTARLLAGALLMLTLLSLAACGGDNLSLCDGCPTSTPAPTLTPTSTNPTPTP